MTTQTTPNYNKRIRRPNAILLYVFDEAGRTLDVLVSGFANHRQALDWMEWRINTLANEYPDIHKAALYYGDTFIAQLTREND